MLPSSLSLLLSAVLLSTSVYALGDFPCAGETDSQSCGAWSIDVQRQGNISSTAVCQPDPLHPTKSYCGYANAACSTNLDCDYGSCVSGQCSGYLGDSCPNGNSDCQAFFFCGTDGKCGGTAAACANGDPTSPIPSPNEQCVSQSCNTTAQTCNAAPAAGMPIGSPCGNDAVCSTGNCVPGTAVGGNLCAAAPATPSGSKKTKRFVLNGSGPNVHECPAGHTACAVGSQLSDGFECIDAATNLEQCGGCVTDGLGQDCTAIPGVESVMCNQGSCIVLSCIQGMAVGFDATSCMA